MVRILAIETSCDETAAAVVVDGRHALSSIVASQDELHAATGGVVPEVAARQHLRAVVPVVRRALAEAQCGWGDLDAVAATAGPGLPGALVVGLNAARGMAFARGLPLIPVDHVEGHVCANWLDGSGPQSARYGEGNGEGNGEAGGAGPGDRQRDPNGSPPPLPALALVVSGGHTELLLMRDHGRFERLGGTRDDAAGEAFDKVARLLGLGYPGGPPLARLAATPEAREGEGPAGPAFRLPRAWLRGTDDFSFSGLKTAVLHAVERPDAPPAAVVARAFEQAVADVLSRKAARVAEREGVRALLLAGGVAANAVLRTAVRARATVPVFIPPPALCTDNAAMIGAAAFRHLDEAVPPQSALDILPTAARRKGRITPRS